MTQQSISDQLIASLISYLPPAVARAVCADPRPLREPRAERFGAAVLFADVSGFTSLTEKLAAQGPDGAEELTVLLNRYFSRMIGLLEQEGGEVVQFSGDALMTVFPSTGGLLAHSVRRAWQAAEQMQTSMAEFARLGTSVGSVALGMKIVIGAGDVLALSVGGVRGRWQYIIAGEPLRQVGEVADSARRGAIVLSPQARALWSEQPLVPRPLTLPNWRTLGNTAIDALITHIPRAITHRLLAGQDDWLAELRAMTVLFLGIGGLEQASLAELQQWMLQLQETVYRYEGSINKLLYDDKGTISIALFGAPPLAHTDDSLRAVRCALALQRVAESLGLRMSIGITTGQVFAGPVGSPTRREYTVMGDGVNLAARLMGLAGRGNILADHATFQATRDSLAWQQLTPQTVKGRAAAVRLYRPGGEQPTRVVAEHGTGLVARRPEIEQIAHLLDESITGRLRLVCVEGEPGSGKSRLVTELARRMRERGLVGLRGNGQAIEQQTPYRAWRDIFETFFNLEGIEDLADQRAQVLERLAGIAPTLSERAPLLNDLLGLGLPENSLTGQLKPKLRQESLQALLVDLLELWASERPLTLVLDDAHWLDSLSWQLTLRLARSLPDQPLLLLLLLRPLDELPAEHVYHQLQALELATRIVLGPLNDTEVALIAAERLGVDKLPAALAELLGQKAAGNPFVAEQLALSLQESGLMQIVDGQCVLFRTPSELRLPETVQGAVLTRLDRLPAAQQLTLKVASVIGRTFAYPTLRDTYPAQLEETQLQGQLVDLTQRALVRPEVQGALAGYSFQQAITHEVTYSTLLHSQRRSLHRRVARWYEQHLTDERADYYQLLARHWRQADDREQEQYYTVLAAKRLSAEYANSEALSYSERALALTTAVEIQYDLHWLRMEIHDRTGQREAQQRDLALLELLAAQLADGQRTTQVANAWAAYYRDTNDYPAAMQALERALASTHVGGNIAGEARALTIWGQVLVPQGAYNEARSHFERALARYRTLNYQRGEANNLSYLGAIQLYLGNFEQARAHELQALVIRQAISDRVGQAASLNNLSSIALTHGDVDEAVAYANDALTIARAIGDRAEEARGLGRLGETFVSTGDASAARTHLEQALRLFQAVGDRRREAECTNMLGMVWRDRGDYSLARRCFEHALTIQQAIGEQNYAAYTLLNLGYVLLLQKDPQAVEVCYAQALEIARMAGLREAEAYALSYRAALHEYNANWLAAEADYQAALALRGDQQAAAIEDRAGLGRVALATGRLALAGEYVSSCLEDLRTHGVDGIEFPMAVYLACYDVLRARNDAAASKVLREAYDLLMQRAAAVSEPEARERMLQNVALNRRVAAEWKATAIMG